MRRALVAAIAWALALEAEAQERVVYSLCLADSAPACAEADAGALDVDVPGCTRRFRCFRGRLALGPLLDTGTIRVDVEARVGPGQSIAPLYVEIVPMRSPELRPCDNALGYAVGTINGLPNDVCDGWESTDWLPITHYVPLGTAYAIRLTFFDNQVWSGQRIYIDCVRIVIYDFAVESTPWTRMKTLYR